MAFRTTAIPVKIGLRLYINNNLNNIAFPVATTDGVALITLLELEWLEEHG